jgi:hypothetical protein
MPHKLLKILLLSILLFFIWPIVISRANDSDAIGIRVIPNLDNLNISHWYASQGLSGSPQLTVVDSYPAIRDGRTVYVNVANIKDNNLYTNILLISYNQGASPSTIDIFGQILKNLKFNSNIIGLGNCSGPLKTNCLNDSDCALGEYCDSQKARIVRDVKRLEDISEIKRLLNNYYKHNHNYPRLQKGSYVPGFSLSTWPSWQNTLAADLGASLPVDPINKMGSCPGFAATTCWDEKTNSFAENLNNKTLPSGTSAYLYYADQRGGGWEYCTQMESGYANLMKYNCFADIYSNKQPLVKDVNLSGFQGGKFNGFVWVDDSDGDKVSLRVELESPEPKDWASNGWRWAAGFNNFSITSSDSGEHFTLSAPSAGKYLPSGYKIKLILDDGRNLPNSLNTQIYPVDIVSGEMVLSNSAGSTVIGQNILLNMFGEDVDKSSLSELKFKNAFLGGDTLSEEQWEKMGFSLKGMSLVGSYNKNQKSGDYLVNVYSRSRLSEKEKTASFKYRIENQPPKLEKISAYSPSGSEFSCVSNCSFNIFDGENISIKVVGADPDGHKISYELLENFGSKISINKSSGVISGLENLNSGGKDYQKFKITVKIFDEYCGNSKESECSNFYSFDLTARPECLSSTGLFLKAKINGPLEINKSGDNLTFGIDNCGQIFNSRGTVAFNGVAEPKNKNQVIVIVSDVSYSMGSNVTIDGQALRAIERLKTSLAGEGGLLDNIYLSAMERLANGLSTKIVTLGYSSSISYRSPSVLEDITNPGVLADIKSNINRYVVQTETNTLEALNSAENFLNSVTDNNTEKIVILISDGLPEVTKYTRNWYCYNNNPQCNCYLDTYPNCREEEARSESCPEIANGKYYNWYPNFCNLCLEYKCFEGGFIEGKNSDGNWYCSYPPVDPPPPATTYLRDAGKFLKSWLSVKKAAAATKHQTCAMTILPQVTCGAGYSLDSWDSPTPKCNSASDVQIQASAMKSKGMIIYTVYYDTQGKPDPKQKMCDWSSGNGLNCDRGSYAFSGTNIAEMMKKIANNLIINKPSEVKIGDYAISDPDPGQLNSSGEVEIKGLSCSNFSPVVTYNDKGSLVFSNLEINYCPVKKYQN